MPDSTPHIASPTDLAAVREIVLGNIITSAETPSPTFGEEALAAFITNRFKELELTNISIDEAGNAAGLLLGSQDGDMEDRRTILVVAHTDKIWPADTNHTADVGAKEIVGRGIADNSVGVGALISLPKVLKELGIKLKADLLLVGTTKSFGGGDLAGIRYFLEHAKPQVAAGICLEGIELGRLSFSSTGMLRGEIIVKSDDTGPCGVIGILATIVTRILEIKTLAELNTEVLLGSIEAGAGYNEPPRRGILKFEIRSEDAENVSRIHRRIKEIVEATDAHCDAKCVLDVLAKRTPGEIREGHPLVNSARQILKKLNVEPCVGPSVSELSALLDRRIPALTLGITRGKNRHTENETIEIDPIFTGLAQIVSILQFIDGADDETLNFSHDASNE